MNTNAKTQEGYCIRPERAALFQRRATPYEDSHRSLKDFNINNPGSNAGKPKLLMTEKG